MANTKQIPLPVSGLETILLQAHTKTAPFVLLRFKAQAVLLASSGVDTAAIALACSRRPSTVEGWLKDWRQRRLSSIFTGHKDNSNAGKLTNEQLEEIKQTLQQPPSATGLPKEFWDVPQLKQYIHTQFDVVYECDDSYHFLLKFSNLSFKYPDTFDRKRDEDFIAERMKSIKTELTPLMNDTAWEVFAVDEVRMDQEAITRRAWLKKGENTVIRVNRNKESQSYIGFLSQKNYHCHLYEMPWQNSEEVLKAVEQFLKEYPNKKIAIVWDNAPFHRSKALRDELAKGGLMERVHLIAMPPYAPDNNPIEHVWGVTKQAIANTQYPSFNDTKKAFDDYIKGRRFAYTF